MVSCRAFCTLALSLWNGHYSFDFLDNAYLFCKTQLQGSFFSVPVELHIWSCFNSFHIVLQLFVCLSFDGKLLEGRLFWRRGGEDRFFSFLVHGIVSAHSCYSVIVNKQGHYNLHEIRPLETRYMSNSSRIQWFLKVI